jgi:hypothetical protein
MGIAGVEPSSAGFFPAPGIFGPIQRAAVRLCWANVNHLRASELVQPDESVDCALPVARPIRIDVFDATHWSTKFG